MEYGINVHLASRERLAQVAAAGIRWIRVDANWDTLEPDRDWWECGELDRVVMDAASLGLRIYATLAYTPGWANGGQPRHVPPTNPQDWYWFVHTIVTRYRHQIQHFGLWNEPNQPQFWSGTAEQYVNTILELGAHAVKAANPYAVVCGPDLAHEGNWASWLTTILDHGGHWLDVITHHCYQGTAKEVIRCLNGPLPWLQRLIGRKTLLQVLQAHGAGTKPVALTEVGWNTADMSEAEQAEQIGRLCDMLDALGWINAVVLYELIDGDGPDGWGLLRADGTPKPAWEQYRHLTVMSQSKESSDG